MNAFQARPAGMSRSARPTADPGGQAVGRRGRVSGRIGPESDRPDRTRRAGRLACPGRVRGSPALTHSRAEGRTGCTRRGRRSPDEKGVAPCLDSVPSSNANHNGDRPEGAGPPQSTIHFHGNGSSVEVDPARLADPSYFESIDSAIRAIGQVRVDLDFLTSLADQVMLQVMEYFVSLRDHIRYGMQSGGETPVLLDAILQRWEVGGRYVTVPAALRFTLGHYCIRANWRLPLPKSPCVPASFGVTGLTLVTCGVTCVKYLMRRPARAISSPAAASEVIVCAAYYPTHPSPST